uniref:C-type lectin domain-containing protein n=1 Tax=Oryzias latipes TaxID=8090 RepID=A0A3P9L118_ORYLA
MEILIPKILSARFPYQIHQVRVNSKIKQPEFTLCLSTVVSVIIFPFSFYQVQQEMLSQCYYFHGDAECSSSVFNSQQTKFALHFKCTPGKPGCPAEWIRFGSSCYFFSVESKSWDEARKFCRAREADLMVINTNDEKTFLVAFRDKPVWIGLTDKVQEGTWKWVDGSPLTLFWGKNQPSDGGGKIHGEEDCAEIRETLGYWNDLACGTSLRWICEKEATLFV